MTGTIDFGKTRTGLTARITFGTDQINIQWSSRGLSIKTAAEIDVNACGKAVLRLGADGIKPHVEKSASAVEFVQSISKAYEESQREMAAMMARLPLRRS